MNKYLALFLGLSVSSFANEGYVPFSTFSKDQKVEYNFVTVKKEKTKPQKYYKSVKDVKIEYTKPAIVEKKEIVKTAPVVVQEKVVVETTPVVEKKKPVEKIVVKKEILQETKVVKEEKIIPVVKERNRHRNLIKQDKYPQVKLQAVYSHLDTKVSGSNSDETANSFEPTVEVKVDEKNKFALTYFNAEASSNDIKHAKLSYKHKVSDANVGVSANYFVKKDAKKSQEIFPSVDVDMNHNIDQFGIGYGASYGAGSKVDYAYDYYANVSVKSEKLNDSAIVVGYKAKTYKTNSEKIEFNGPYIGVNTTF